jgi:hypothetical protein
VKRLGSLFVLLVLAAGAQADGWHFEMVDEGDWIGWRNDLVLDSSGFPHVAYYDVGTENLRYAHWDGSQWRVEIVHDWDGNCIGGISIVVDSADRPRIAYRAPYEDGSALWYASWDGSEWRKEVVDHETEWSCGYEAYLKLDSGDRPRISYAASIGGFVAKLKYAEWDGSSWQVETIEDTGNVGWNCCLELDSQDRSHIAYRDTCYESLKYAIKNGSSWDIEIVESGRGVGFCISLELDSDDHPHIASVETHPNDENDIKYAYWDGSRWRFDIIESGRDQGHCVSMALDSAERPHVTYYDWDTSRLKYARWNGVSWRIKDLPMIFSYSCIVVNAEDQPCISCHSWPDPEGLAYIWHEGEFGVELAELTAVPAGEGVLVNWRFEGEIPAGVRVLRSVGEGEPVAVHENQLPGTATRYLDRLDKGLKPLVPGIGYRYWLEVTGTDGTTTRFGPTEAVTVSDEAPELILYAAYPSPSREAVNIAYSLPEDGRVVLSVYDLSGRRVAVPLDGELTAGRHEVTWSCADVPSGVYLYKLETDAGSLTGRCVIGR